MTTVDTTRSIAKTASHFFSGTALSRISGMMRDIVMAFIFGTHPATATFFAAYRLAHLMRRLFGEGALQSAFIPQFETLRAEDPLRACLFFRDVKIFLLAGLSILITLIMCVLWIFSLTANANRDTLDIIWLTLLLMPSLLFICLYGINASLLQCAKSYFTPSVSPVFFNLTWIIGVLLLKHLSPEQAMPLLTGFILIACVAQWAVTLPQTISFLRKNHMISFWKGVRCRSSDLKLLGKPLLLGIVGVAATQVNNALDPLFARFSDPSGPAYLWYAIRLQQLPLALFGIALSGALLPPLTRACKDQDNQRFNHFLTYALQKSFIFMLPLSIVLLFFGNTFINLIYQHGNFTASSSLGTTHCLWGYTLGLIPMTFVLILAPALYALNDYRNPARASLYAVGINISLNALFVFGFQLGAPSVALATSFSAFFQSLFLYRALKAHNPNLSFTKKNYV